MPLFSPKGEMLRYQMESYVREAQTRYGYEHVWTGHMVKESLYRQVGPLEHYSDVMFPPMVDEEHRLPPQADELPVAHDALQRDGHPLLPRAAAALRRVRHALPLREVSGELTGLTRVRALTQDDCHIFCTPEQIQDEFGRCARPDPRGAGHLRLHRLPRAALAARRARASTSHDDEKWAQRRARAASARWMPRASPTTPAEGEAAFYGPKADFMARDALGREWQLSTIQVDFIQPARLGCEYIGEDGAAAHAGRHPPRGDGLTERFLGVLIEHFAGAFPVWLAPVQAAVIPIADRHVAYAAEVGEQLQAAGLRVEVDSSSDRMQNKIRQAQVQKVPYMLVVGDREREADAVAVRLRTGENLGALPVAEFIERAQRLVASKSLALTD